MINYPNGKQIDYKEKRIKTKNEISVSSANRGMNLEHEINLSNLYYSENNICLVTKRPTPIKVVKVDYTKGAIITSAFFEKQSTTDYNGVYKGRYLDFEAKSTISKTSFPLSNISFHQINHLKKVIEHGGIAFFIISFSTHNKVFMLDASYIINYYENSIKKSIPYDVVCEVGTEIKQSINPRLCWVDALNEIYYK